MDNLLAVRRLSAGLALAALAVWPNPAHAAAEEQVVATGVAGPCTQPQVDKLRQRNECSGRAVLTGSWNGTIRFVARGKVEIVTGNARGTIMEEFRGRTDAGRKGTIRLSGPFAVDGATGYGTAHLAGSGVDGALRHARCVVDAYGTMPITTGPQLVTFSGVCTY